MDPGSTPGGSTYLIFNHLKKNRMFNEVKKKMQDQFALMLVGAEVLFLTDVERDALWQTYLSSFPEGSNPIYKERTEHDCNACKQFIRPFGNVVAVVNNKLVSIWDFQMDGPYGEVAKAMSKFVKSAPIANVFVTKVAKLGTDTSRVLEPNGDITKWDHFYFELPKKFVDKNSVSEESVQAQYRDAKNVFKRSLDEITTDAVETVLELIAQNSLYRGEESKGALTAFLTYKKEYDKLPRQTGERDNYAWITSTKAGAIAKMRNTAMGTLLVNLSDGMDLDAAVAAFEKIMAPANYKRPAAIVTRRMVEDAQKTVAVLGLENSLGRRYAVPDDITVNNVIFANRNSKKAANAFEELAAKTTVNPKSFSKVEEMSIADFIEKVVPKATRIEMLFENKHVNNLVSLIAPADKSAPPLFKWDNGFSWAYNNDVTDSIREKVKAAGGRVDGELRVSLSWYNYDDLDLHVVEPDGRKIYYGDKGPSRMSGQLDVDMNAGGPRSREAVENIIWTDKRRMGAGEYKVIVNNFCKRENVDVGFEVEIEHGGQIHKFAYAKAVADRESVHVATIKYGNGDVSITSALDSSVKSKDVYGIKTNSFQNVSMMMYSPNHWDGREVGNKHYFFIVENAVNPDTPRGFFNEFLRDDLLKQKRVFEALGNKMRVEPSNVQLTGFGFSSTQPNSVVVKVEGTFTRTIKVNF